MRKVRVVNDKDGHITECWLCYDMARRGYRREQDYFFGEKLRPIKYRIVYNGKTLRPRDIKPY